MPQEIFLANHMQLYPVIYFTRCYIMYFTVEHEEFHRVVLHLILSSWLPVCRVGEDSEKSISLQTIWSDKF